MFNLQIPQSIFVHADSFLKASQSKTDPPHPYDIIAMVTSSAFANELYLKCLLHIETGQLFKSQHNLRKLFLKLNEQTQTEIERRFDAEMAKQKPYDYSDAPDPELAKKISAMRPMTLRAALKEGADAFIEWRYLYETAGDSSVFNLFALPPILREAILARRPEWARFTIKATKVGSVQPTSPVQKTPEQSGEPG